MTEHTEDITLPITAFRARRFGDSEFATLKCADFMDARCKSAKSFALCSIQNGKAYAHAFFEDGKVIDFASAQGIIALSREWLATLCALEGDSECLNDLSE